MGSAIESIKGRNRSNSDSDNSSDNETSYYQERKNFEFFFKPRDIERHMDIAINRSGSDSSDQSSSYGDIHTNNGIFASLNLHGTCNGNAPSADNFQDFAINMDVDMIPEADDLMSALMT